MEFSGCVVEVLEKRSVLGDDELKGSDVFKHYLVEMIFRERKMKLSELPKHLGEPTQPADAQPAAKTSSAGKTERAHAPSSPGSDPAAPEDRSVSPTMHSYIGIIHFGHTLLVPTKINDGEVTLLIPDSGAFNHCISPAIAREVTKLRDDPEMRVEGLSGSVKKGYSANALVIQFGR
jgi:hypothetical protein